jgi:hypothetical protein
VSLESCVPSKTSNQPIANQSVTEGGSPGAENKEKHRSAELNNRVKHLHALSLPNK